MKRIVLCGSRTFKDYIIQIGYKLEEEGYEVVMPKEFFVSPKNATLNVLF